MDDVSLSSVDGLFQITAADTANARSPTTVFVRCDDSFVVSSFIRSEKNVTQNHVMNNRRTGHVRLGASS